VATMATLGVRSRSLAGERRSRNPLNEAVQRTTANGRERLLTVAMQKVVGSSPIIRSLLLSPFSLGEFHSPC
jgi:hypothetical protein